MKKLMVLLFLPLALILDLLLFASGLKCVSCGNFWVYLNSTESFSFPIITGVLVFLNLKREVYHK